jgi:hypothetical protein
VAKDDGTDLIRAEAIVRVGIDYSGNVTAQLADGEGVAVTLVVPGAQQSQHTPDDFHRQLIRALAQLSDAAGAFVVRPVCDEQYGWRWINDPL